MKIFISWSGETSRELASAFREWLPAVIQAVKPYFSPDDIAKGTRWSSEIAKELDASSIGLICLTRENLAAPWIMFEAGALAKKLEKAKVCPIVFGINPTDVKDPLAQFQASRFEKNEIKKVVKMMNQELGESSLSSDVFDSVFNMWWPRLEEKVIKILEDSPEESQDEIRSEKDLLEEVLSLVRSTHRSTRGGGISYGAYRDLVLAFKGIVEIASEWDPIDLFYEDLKRIYRATKHFLDRSDSRRSSDLLEMLVDTRSKFMEMYRKSHSGELSEDEQVEERIEDPE